MLPREDYLQSEVWKLRQLVKTRMTFQTEEIARGRELCVVLFCCCCSVTKLCLTLCDFMDCSMPGSPVLHHLLEFAQTHVHWVSDAIQPSHPLSPSSPFVLCLSQHQSLFQQVSCSHQVPKVLELQLQHQSFRWVFRVDFSFKIDWFDLLAVQGTLKSFLQHHSSKASILWCSAF